MPAPRVLAITAFLFVLPQVAVSDPVIVYDNTSFGTNGSYVPEGLPQGFWRFNQYVANELMGDQITLASSERTVVEFDLLLSSSERTTLASLVFSLYDLDFDAGTPGTCLWTTTLTNVVVDGNTMVPILVPDKVVPDTLVWIASADSNTAGLATFDPPTVGSPSKPDYFWDYDTETLQWYPMWFEGSPAAGFGARVLAVPEPTTIVLFAVGSFLAAVGSRCRRSPRSP